MARPIKLMALCLLSCVSCYASTVKAKLKPQGELEHPLFVGTSVDGDLVVAASHYDAMRGVAIAADEIGENNKDGLTCAREMPTGTHVPAWYCRYDKEAEQERRATQDWLVKPRNGCPPGGSCGNR